MNDAETTLSGNALQILAAASGSQGKARLPTVNSLKEKTVGGVGLLCCYRVFSVLLDVVYF